MTRSFPPTVNIPNPEWEHAPFLLRIEEKPPTVVQLPLERDEFLVPLIAECAMIEEAHDLSHVRDTRLRRFKAQPDVHKQWIPSRTAEEDGRPVVYGYYHIVITYRYIEVQEDI